MVLRNGAGDPEAHQQAHSALEPTSRVILSNQITAVPTEFVPCHLEDVSAVG